MCYLSRWDRRKRPERFLQLAASFPDVRFVAFGTSRDPDFERDLRIRYGHLPNLELPGHVDQFTSNAVDAALSESWVLVNTSLREGLPNAFLEAAAHGCAILSAADPDGFATRFGVAVRDDGFEQGLRQLFQEERWRECGERARSHIAGTFERDIAVGRHLSIYEAMLEPGR